MSTVSSVTKFFATANEGFATTLASTILSGATTIPLTSASGLTNGSVFVGIIEPGLTKQQVFTGTVDTSGVQITGVVWTRGSNADHSAGVAIVDYVTGTNQNMMSTGILVAHQQSGVHKSGATYAAPVLSGTVTGTYTLGGTPTITTPTIQTRFDGWTTTALTPNTVTHNGNRNYSLVFNSTDLTGYISNGMRLKMTRTVTAPTQSTSLNGTTQYYSKTSPAGMTFTDDFVVSAWVKLNAYNSGANQTIASRYNGTSGWDLNISTSGQVVLEAFNAGSANFSLVNSYQAIPLNKWVHVTAQLDMSAFTNTATTSYIMIDGLDVPAQVQRGGTNPTALIQAGNLEVGSRNGGLLPFNGKIAQVAIYNAHITQATIAASSPQTLAGTETSLISAYSFNNSINDLNANANNLTPNGSAVATNTDSPFAGGANASTAYTAGTTEYGEVFAISFSTNTTVTVQVPDGYAIPTSGGVSAVSYSTQAYPLGWPGPIVQIGYAQLCTSFTTTAVNTTTDIAGLTTTVYVPAGRKVRIVGYARDMKSSQSAGNGVWLYLLDSGSIVGTAAVTTPVSGYASPGLGSVVISPAASGSRTYKLQGSQDAAGTYSFEAGTTAPAYISVELV